MIMCVPSDKYTNADVGRRVLFLRRAKMHVDYIVDELIESETLAFC